jgi:hypothetical protein
MKKPRNFLSKGSLWITALFLFLLPGGPLFTSDLFSSEKQESPLVPDHQAFQPGEVLKYEISWSKMLRAGTAVMEVQEKTLPDGQQVLAFTLTGRSRGVLEKLFPVRDTVQSVFDPKTMQSLSYTISESFGKKKRQRSLVFDRSQNTVIGRLNEDPPQTQEVPVQVQDGLASLYYLRTKNNFTIGTVFVIDVHDSGKNWAVEVHTLGRERVKTEAGEFSTIKLKTRPLYEGTYRNKGEILIWLTDDSRKIPVLMKSTIKIGSFVFTLKDMKPGLPEKIKES